MDFNQNIFTLRAQINYIEECLAGKKPTLNKVKNVFNSREELAAVKAGITQKIADLVQEAPLEYIKDLENLRAQWDAMQEDLVGEKEISDKLEIAAMDLKDRMQRIYRDRFASPPSRYTFIRDQKGELKVSSAVQPHFERLPLGTISQVQERFPETIRSLFEAGLQLSEGKLGGKLQEAFEFLPGAAISFDEIAALLLFLLRSKKAAQPEILAGAVDSVDLAMIRKMSPEDLEKILLSPADKLRDKQKSMLKTLQSLTDKITIAPLEKDVFVFLFRRYVNQLKTSSLAKVQLLLEKGKVKQAVEAAHRIKNAVEKSKALARCIEVLVKANDYKAALESALPITLKSERIYAFQSIIGGLIESDQLNTAIGIAQSSSDPEEKAIVLHEIILKLAAIGRLKEAIELAEKLEDPESRSYTLSTLVRVFAQRGKYKSAKSVAFSIADEGAQEDALGYILKALLFEKKVDESIELVESIKDPASKKKAAKLIESAMLARHQDDKVQKVRLKFALFRPFPMRAA